MEKKEKKMKKLPERPCQPKIYELAIDSRNFGWLLPADIPNRGDWILRTAFANWDKCGEGFGGSTMNLRLTSGDTFVLRGGWHTNSEELLRATGIDFTNLHYTFMVATEANNEENEVMADLDWHLGDFDRQREYDVLSSLVPLIGAIGVVKYSMGGSMSRIIRV